MKVESRVRLDPNGRPPHALAKEIVSHRHDLAKPTQETSADKASTLPEELVEEILLRFPPDEPAQLIRATLVCKAWHSVVSDDTFRRRYHRFHGTPPLQGYISTQLSDSTIRFVSTTSISVAASHIWVLQFDDDSSGWKPSALDCRHDRVLIQIEYCSGFRRSLIVWDTIAGSQQHLSLPTCLQVPCFPRYFYVGAVLCAKDSCDHHDCHGGPFLVVLVWMSSDYEYRVERIRASVYSSETGAWSSPTNPNDITRFVDNRRSGLLVGDALYFSSLCKPYNIVKYDLCKHELSVMHLPASASRSSFVLIKGKDGVLGVAVMLYNGINMWSWQVDNEGVGGWVKDRVMEIDDARFLKGDLICMAEGTNTVFIRVHRTVVFTVDLRSRQVRKIDEKDTCYNRPILPYMSFSIPKC